jgi:tripartite-type tricarboxylate transporter receptor subunit TctC
MMKAVLRILVLAFGVLAAPLAQAQTYPDRPIKLLVPLQAGSAVDIVARLVAEKVGVILKQSVYVENQPGAAGMIGVRGVARSAPDGYTILVANDSVLTMIPAVEPDAGYDPQKDLVPVVRLAIIPMGLIASTKFPATSLKEMIALAKDKPGAIDYGSGGIASPQHIAMELLMRSAGISLLHVPYRGITAATTDVVAGHITMTFTAMSAVFPFIKDSRVRLYGISSGHRMAQLPDVPTVAEAGVPGYNFVPWCALFAPAGTPRDIVMKLNAAALEALNHPDVKARLFEVGLEADPSTPEELGAYLRQEYERTGELIRAANIKKQ